MNPVLFKIKMKLSDYCKDASSVMAGGQILTDCDADIHSDKVYDKLFDEVNDDFDVILML